MKDNYAKIVQDNLTRLYKNLPSDLSRAIPARMEDENFIFSAFGEECRINPNGIILGKDQQTSVPCILISLYALNAKPDQMILTPYRSFKEIPDSMPYAGAFTTHTEKILVPYVEKIKGAAKTICEKLNGQEDVRDMGGDFSFVVCPLPKIALCYIFYEADDEFPASATCLYSNNAHLFLKADALADVGEYTSKAIIKLLE